MSAETAIAPLTTASISAKPRANFFIEGSSSVATPTVPIRIGISRIRSDSGNCDHPADQDEGEYESNQE